MTEFYEPIFPWEDLLIWYTEHGRHHLPWREYEEDRATNNDSIIYRVWLSEILLQQTQVDRVVPYFERILTKYPTIHDLARASYDEFFPYYQGMGYYSRARNILKTAVIVSEEYGGIFPREKNLLMKLPGVWWYTSSAILAFGSGESYLAWDTNLEKVFARYTHGRKDLKLSEREKQEIEEDFREFMRKTEKNLQSEQGWKKWSGGSGGETVWAKKKTANRWAERGGASFLPPETFGTFPSKSMEMIAWKVHEDWKKWKVRAINNALMDFASMIDLKNSDMIDWINYPIVSGRFYETRGSLEPKEVKKSQSFPLPDATIIIILHKDHKIYYSDEWWGKSDKIKKQFLTHLSLITHTSYLPFILPPSLTRNTRKYVQDYFREHYRLELSVRPVHRKWISVDGKPYIVVNAQIQAGVYGFSEYTKSEAKPVIDSL